MRIVAVEELRRNLSSFLDLPREGEEFLLARKGRVKALVRPPSDEDAFRPIGASAFRDRAGRILRDIARTPRLITWYGKPAAAVVGPPDHWSRDPEEEDEQ
jgi:antitoxin (DNA-binding transcriptional repressor) of toxin-antitoxin stability system